ncbi:MAG: hypothetical protein ACREAE_06535 [Nitrosopumilaceae archaeon]
MNNLNPTSNKKTRSVSYRTDTKILDEIMREARHRETSTNILVNQVLRRFVDFERYEQRLGILPFPKELIFGMMKHWNDKDIKLFAEGAFKFINEAVILTHKRQDLASFLLVLKEYVKVAGIASDHIMKDGKDIFVVQHDMGSNCSKFTKELLAMIFERLAGKRVEFELTDSSVIATVELPEDVHSKLIS